MVRRSNDTITTARYIGSRFPQPAEELSALRLPGQTQQMYGYSDLDP
jgi:hypothetical protein